ncbi:hypothetical protein C0991_007783 [Blastosporella zonata]|nr:hypothetical protein C0991_007783 [Blastosporella zonata]
MQLPFTFVLAALFVWRPVHARHSTLVSRAHTVGYTGTSGPLGWSTPTENPLCSTGTNQSPINVDSTTTSVNTDKLVLTIPDAASMFTDTGHSLEAAMSGKLTLGASAYQLVQFHFHTPAEHRLNQEFFPLEMHMVFKAAPAQPADPYKLVIGVLFEVSGTSTTALLSTLAKSIPTSQGTPVKTGTLSFAPIIKQLQSQKLSQYQGSLTTPPCKEGITWLVLPTPLDVDVATFKAFKKVIKFNARYTQNTPGQQNLITYAKANYPAAT